MDWLVLIALGVIGNVLSTLITDAIHRRRDKKRAGDSSWHLVRCRVCQPGDISGDYRDLLKTSERVYLVTAAITKERALLWVVLRRR